MTDSKHRRPKGHSLTEIIRRFRAGRKYRTAAIDTDRFYILAPILPYVDILLHSITVDRQDFTKIVTLASEYQNDPRMVEMVRRGGDASTKVPYLIDVAETAESILASLRETAQPHIEYIHRLPDSMQATIHLLLSINTVPRGCEACGIPALLEIDRIQGELVHTLRGLMEGRKLAEDFFNRNISALQALDRDWPRLREKESLGWSGNTSLPDQARVHYKPFFDSADRLIYVQESCAIIEAPDAQILRQFTPPVLQNPLRVKTPAPTTGSADWLIRNVGKIGRHFTRALLGIIKTRLAAEQVALEARNYELINERAMDALRRFVEGGP